MVKFNIALIGEQESGKTEIFKRIKDKSSQFSEKYYPTTGAYFYTKILENNNTKLTLWDTVGDKRYESLLPLYTREAHQIIFFVDLSKEITGNITAYQEQIKKLASSSKAPIILVGSKRDLVENPEQKLAEIQELIRKDNEIIKFEACQATSAKDNWGIDELESILKQNLERNPEYQRHIKQERAEQEFLDTIKHLPKSKKDVIRSALMKFKKDKDANYFVRTCQEQIQGKYPHLMNALLSLVVVALVTAAVALVGFGIGFAVGIWAGPLAFMSALTIGNAAAVSVLAVSTSVGLVSGAYTLFHKEKYSNPAIEKLEHLASLK